LPYHYDTRSKLTVSSTDHDTTAATAAVTTVYADDIPHNKATNKQQHQTRYHTGSLPRRRRQRQNQRTPIGTTWLMLGTCTIVLFLVGIVVAVVELTSIDTNFHTISSHAASISASPAAAQLLHVPVNDYHSYTCPTTSSTNTTTPVQDESAINFDPVRFNNHYLKEDSHVRDLEDFVTHYRQLPYDDWGQSYEHMKNGMTPWKQQTIVPQVLHKLHHMDHNNDDDMVTTTFTIYESAIGMGLNALMTVELIQQAVEEELQQQKQQHQQLQLQVYGNEYLVSSTQRANAFLDRMWPDISTFSTPTFEKVPSPSIQVHKGTICTGDSTNLTFVPSNSFDLVYTGYILYVCMIACGIRQRGIDPVTRWNFCN
jgi:hypothetical protein